METLLPTSRVWIYKSNRVMTETEQSLISKELDDFIPGWASHGNQLFGAAEIVHDWFVVLVVDESKSMASGCSIDSSVQFIKMLGEKCGLDFFDRMHVLVEKDGQAKNVHFSDLSDYQDCTLYNPFVDNLADYRSNWKVKVSESSFA